MEILTYDKNSEIAW